LETYGPLDDSEGLAIEAPAKRGFVLVRYLDKNSAQRAKDALAGVGDKEGEREGRGPPLIGGRRVPKVQYSVMVTADEEVSVRKGGKKLWEKGEGRNAQCDATILLEERVLTLLPSLTLLLLPSIPPSLPPSLSSATRYHTPSHWIRLSKPPWRWIYLG